MCLHLATKKTNEEEALNVKYRTKANGVLIEMIVVSMWLPLSYLEAYKNHVPTRGSFFLMTIAPR